jgi:hypothetical protein
VFSTDQSPDSKPTELAERIRLEGSLDRVGDARGQSFTKKRRLKFNTPLDLRTPSYSDCSDALQANLPEMWRQAFGRALLDAMARHRVIVLSLWS